MWQTICPISRTLVNLWTERSRLKGQPTNSVYFLSRRAAKQNQNWIYNAWITYFWCLPARQRSVSVTVFGSLSLQEWVCILNVVSATVFRLNALNQKIIKGAIHGSDKYTTLASCEHVWYREQVFLLGYFMPKKRALTGLKRPIKKPTRQMSLVHIANDSLTISVFVSCCISSLSMFWMAGCEIIWTPQIWFSS